MAADIVKLNSSARTDMNFFGGIVTVFFGCCVQKCVLSFLGKFRNMKPFLKHSPGI